MSRKQSWHRRGFCRILAEMSGLMLHRPGNSMAYHRHMRELVFEVVQESGFGQICITISAGRPKDIVVSKSFRAKPESGQSKEGAE